MRQPPKKPVLVFQHVAAHQGLYRALLSERGATVAVARQRAILTRLAERHVSTALAAGAPNPLPDELLAHFAAGALQGLLAGGSTTACPTHPRRWRASTRSCSPVASWPCSACNRRDDERLRTA